MKNIVKMMMVLAVLLVLGVGQVWAYPISDGATVSLQTSFTGVNGAFKVYDEHNHQVLNADGSAFLTFCVEREVSFWPGFDNKYTATINNDVRSGTNPGTFKQELSDGTKYLYWNFVNGTLANYNNDAASAGALQYAIWHLQGYVLNTQENNAAQKYLSQVPLDNGNAAGYNVKVMNLWTANGAAQSQLIAQVPEPGTLLLLGSGLAGLALYRRRTSK